MTKPQLWAVSLPVGTLSAVVYGLVHDQISVRLSPAYLMDWHPEIVASRDPTVVALAWGVAATWWFGLILGAVLALAATLGQGPMAPWRSVGHAMMFVFALSAVSATVAYGITKGFALELPETFGPVYAGLSHVERLAFTQTAAMHETSYDVAAVATLVAAGWVWWRRRTACSTPSPSSSPDRTPWST